LLSVVTRAQPPALDLLAVAEFLAEGANDQWRYLTLGFGDQAARLAALTPAGSLDGAYHTARELDALRESGLAQLDGLVWQPAGVEGLRPLLETMAGDEGWSVRWVFVAHPAYEPILRETGWVFDRTLAEGIDLWRKDRVWPVAPWTLERSGPNRAARWWGVVPLLAFGLAAGLARLGDRRLRVATEWSRRLLFAGLVLLFPIGWNEVVHVSQAPGVFLAYRGVLVFASDTLLLLLLLSWSVERWLFPGQARRLRFGPPLIGLAWIGLILAVGLSLSRSVDASISFAFLVHLVLLGALYLYLQTEPQAWRRIALLLVVQLVLQGTLGLTEFFVQSTNVLKPLHLPFVGTFSAYVPGASVVQTADGTRWLRAYGSLWHPNVLGAVLLLCLAGPVLLLLKEGKKGNKGTKGNRGTKRNAIDRQSLPTDDISLLSLVSPGSLVTLLMFVLGFATLALSFSRSAWVGTATAGGLLLVLLPRQQWRRLWPALAAAAVVLAAIVLPYRALFFTRATADARSPLERYSVEERASVARVALNLAGENLWTGVGAGAFVQALAADPSIKVTREPVHNVPLLVLAETGLPGALALAALVSGIGLEMWRRRKSGAVSHVLTALLAGLLVTALFDHFLWSSLPGRLLAVLALGLWAAGREGPEQGL
jgi:O-antigen ligase